MTLALEDVDWLHEDDKRRTVAFVDRATRFIELARLPECRFYALRCKGERRALQRTIDGTPLELIPEAPNGNPK